MEIVGYVTVCIYKIRGTPPSTGTNRKYQEKYAYLEIFKVNLFCRKQFFRQHKIIFIMKATLLIYLL